MENEVKATTGLGSKMDVGAVRFGTNRTSLITLLLQMNEEEKRIREGGGAKAAEAQRAKGRLTVRERLAPLLLDKGSEWTELGLLGGPCECMGSSAERLEQGL